MSRPIYQDELALLKEESSAGDASAMEAAAPAISLDFDDVFERYSSMVYSLAFKMLGNREDALDLSQEIFLTVYRKLDSFRGECSLKTWIYGITIHRVANRFRWWNRIRRRGTVSLEEHLFKEPGEEPIHELKSGYPSPEEALLCKEERAELERLLLRLPLEQRIAVILRDVDGLSYEEIAASTRTSLGTVKSRIARGRMTLKRLYNETMN